MDVLLLISLSSTHWQLLMNILRLPHAYVCIEQSGTEQDAFLSFMKAIFCSTRVVEGFMIGLRKLVRDIHSP